MLIKKEKSDKFWNWLETLQPKHVSLETFNNKPKRISVPQLLQGKYWCPSSHRHIDNFEELQGQIQIRSMLGCEHWASESMLTLNTFIAITQGLVIPMRSSWVDQKPEACESWQCYQYMHGRAEGHGLDGYMGSPCQGQHVNTFFSKLSE